MASYPYWVRPALAMSMAALMSACATNIYQTTTATYVDAGHALTSELKTLDGRLETEETRDKLNSIIKDNTCPINFTRIFVRDGHASDAFAQALSPADLSHLRQTDGCQKLLKCESQGDRCGGDCYTELEARCIDHIDTAYSPTGGLHTSTHFASIRKALDARLDQVEYNRTLVTSNQVTTQGIQTLTSYLDLLSKLTEGEKSNYATKAKTFTDDATKLLGYYSKLPKSEVTSTISSDSSHGSDAFDSLGTLVDQIKQKIKDEQDVDAIKDVVLKNDSAFEKNLAFLQLESDRDAKRILDLNIRSTDEELKEIETSYARTSNPTLHRDLMTRRDAIMATYGADPSDALKKVFSSLQTAHDALLSLLKNPTPAQQKAIQDEYYSSFKDAVTQAADVIGKIMLIK
jgi:hypothetical protein